MNIPRFIWWLAAIVLFLLILFLLGLSLDIDLQGRD